MKPQPAVVDVSLSTLDQAAPVTDKPIGRLSSLVNAQVKLYQNPRFNVQDGSVAHVKVEKRDAFVTMSTTTLDTQGVPKGRPIGTPQVFFGGGDALRMVVNNRLFTKTQHWVEDTNATDGDTAVFPQTLRSQPIYTADSTAEAPDMAVIGDVRCVVWRELSESNSSDCPPGVPGTAPPAQVPTAFDGVRVQFSSSAGIMVPAFTLDPVGSTPVYRKARVVAFNNVFWVIQDVAHGPASLPPFNVSFSITVFDTNGVQVGATTIGTGSLNEGWDVTTINTQGVVIAMPAGGTGVTFTSLTFNGSTFTTATHTDATIACRAVQCAWLRDDTQAANTGYLATVDDPSGPSGALTASTIHAYRVVSSVATLTYPVVSGVVNQSTVQYISTITGYHVPGGNNLIVGFSLMDLAFDLDKTTYGATTPDQQNSEAVDEFTDQINNVVVTVSVIAGGSSTTITARYGLSIVSRPFILGTDYVAIGYYPARIFGPLSPAGNASQPAGGHSPNRPANPSNFQPTWYVIPLALVQPIAGRFEYGLASADYQVLTFVSGAGPAMQPDPRNRCLTSPCVLPTGAVAMPLGYRAEQNIPNQALVFGSAVQSSPVDAFTFGSYNAGNTVGVKMFTIGPDCGRPFIVGQASYYPGLMGAIVEPFDVTITEQGLAAPECPRVLKSALANPVTTNLIGGSHSYRAVFEWTTPAGRAYKSLPSAAFSYTIVKADALAIAVQVHNLFPTLKKNVKLSVYATGQITATKDGTAVTTTPATNQPGTPQTGETVSAYKITNDLTPLYSDPTTQISTFNDYYIIGQQAAGEQLYTDQGQLPRYPAPAHRGGCVWLNRPWVIGYDNALWFGGEIVDGQGEYFNPGMRVTVPTNEEITAIAPMDSFLLIFCSGSIWYLPETASLPSSTGVGAIPTAIRLPFEMGGTGFTSVIRQGCMYSSSQGGVWMITRSLDNAWIGQHAKDDLSDTITGMCIAGNNVLVTNGSFVVAYDTNLGAWGRWTLAGTPTMITAFGGVAMFNDTGLVWVQTPGTYLDHDVLHAVSYYIPTAVAVSPIHVGGIRSWKRTWEVQVQGQVLDFCTLSFTLAYGDYNANVKTYQTTPVVPGVLEEAIRPTLQLATSVGLTVTDAQNASTVTGQGFTFEVMALYVGLEKGPKKLPPGSRVKT